MERFETNRESKMSTLQTNEGTTPNVSPGKYSPVTVHVSDSIGAIFLGIFAKIFLIGWIRSEACRNAEGDKRWK
jgi:hypothetical protein